MEWSVLAGAAALALVALLGAAWTDRTDRRRRQERLADPPERAVPGLEPDRGRPTYVPAHSFDQARAGQPLSPDRRQYLARAIERATSLEGGWARDRFVTDPETGWAVLWRPLVLVTERIDSFRELLPAIERARLQDCGLVVVASAFDDASLDSLAVNALSGRLDCLAVRCPPDRPTTTPGAGSARRRGRLDPAAPRHQALAVAAMAAGTAVIESSQLRSGWLGTGGLGHPVVWVSDRSQSWAIDDWTIEPEPTDPGLTDPPVPTAPA
ncbi:MAG: hypothetical protein LBJ44_00760 [Propionibacteriaceae bacterium]|nr:hypothetical protein [Propionibacteriaceae bacterium]